MLGRQGLAQKLLGVVEARVSDHFDRGFLMGGHARNQIQCAAQILAAGLEPGLLPQRGELLRRFRILLVVRPEALGGNALGLETVVQDQVAQQHGALGGDFLHLPDRIQCADVVADQFVGLPLLAVQAIQAQAGDTDQECEQHPESQPQALPDAARLKGLRDHGRLIVRLSCRREFIGLLAVLAQVVDHLPGGVAGLSHRDQRQRTLNRRGVDDLQVG